ncbi:MAG: hypothetical protein KDC61_06585 [Saprospiraceae bacterium]|nr:hypothetical protein [Saprospiraceae bacterium]MCB0574213.1 hypothetical protein [Saprospiraceae bacterium]
MKRWILLLAVLACTVWIACKSDYEKMLDREMASGIRYDSIFFGLYFGMPASDFYKHCFELNRQGMVTNGPENNTVLYSFYDYRYPLDMNFYPAFEKGRIYKMGVVFNYQGWAPWNKQLFSDKLAPDVLDILEKWYGKGFIKIVRTPGDTAAWVKVNGNRQILVMLQNERNVRVEITDLTVTPEQKETPVKPGDRRPVWEKHEK